MSFSCRLFDLLFVCFFQEYLATVTDGEKVFVNQSTSPNLEFKDLVPGQTYEVNVSNLAEGVSSRAVPVTVTLGKKV